MRKKFLDAVRKADTQALLHLTQESPATAEELKLGLYIAVAELEDNELLAVFTFFHMFTKFDVNVRYSNGDTLAHVAVKKKKMLAAVLLDILIQVNMDLLDAEGKKAEEYWSETERKNFEKTSLLYARQLADGFKKKVVPLAEDALFKSAKELIEQNDLYTMPKKKLDDIFHMAERALNGKQILELLRYSKYKAYRFIVDTQYDVSAYPTLAEGVRNIRLAQGLAGLPLNLWENIDSYVDGKVNAVEASADFRIWNEIFNY